MKEIEKLNIKWSIEDLDNALKAANKEATEINREKLAAKITDGFVESIVAEINERLEVLAENI